MALVAVLAAVAIIVRAADRGASSTTAAHSQGGAPSTAHSQGGSTAARSQSGGGQSTALGAPQTAVASSRPAPSPLRRGAPRSWQAMAASLPARVGVAVVPLGRGPTKVLGALRGGHSWSTIKVPILVTLLRERNGVLDATEKAWARAALTASDNDAAAALFNRIEASRGGLKMASAAVSRTLRAAGGKTAVATAPPPSGAISTYGQTKWPLRDSARFFASLARGCLLGPRATRYALALAEEVIPEQRWGLGAVGQGPFRRVAFKGGWGPEGSASGPYLVRQAGLLRTGEHGVAVALAARADSGSFTAGVAALDRVAAWLAGNLRKPRRDEARGACRPR